MVRVPGGQAALAGLFIAATAANTRPTGPRAFAARAIVTLAVAVVASEALRQVQQPAQATGAAAEEGGMASLLALVSGAEGQKTPGSENPAAVCGADVGGGRGGEGTADVACSKVSQVSLSRHLG